MLPLFQLCRVDLILSRIGDHGVVSFILLPIQAPRHLTACPSSATLMAWDRGGSSGWTRLVSMIRVLWSGEPIGITLVFSRLNFAPEARHHFARMRCRSE